MADRPAAVRGREAFRQLLRSRRRARSGPVTVHFVPADEAGSEVQVAYAVGRNVGTAVTRNRWRRRLRVVASELSEQVQPGRYLIGLAPDVGRLTFDELRERVGDTMRRASGARQ